MPESFASPAATYETNAIGTALLTQAVRGYATGGAAMPRIVFTSSAEVYGVREPRTFRCAKRSTAPGNAVRREQSVPPKRFCGGGARVRHGRRRRACVQSHRPGSERTFRRALAAPRNSPRSRAGGDPLLLVGNLDAARDFLDVRDVVAAYLALARDGAPGETYNVCSGTAVRDARPLAGFDSRSPALPSRCARIRSACVRSTCRSSFGSAGKVALAHAVGVPPIPLDRSLREVYERARVGNPRRPR